MHYTRISADCHIDLPMLPLDIFKIMRRPR
jgi:hypothetical protein